VNTQPKEYINHEQAVGQGYWEDWSEWTPCDCNGMQFRSKNFVNANGSTDTIYENRECKNPNIDSCGQLGRGASSEQDVALGTALNNWVLVSEPKIIMAHEDPLADKKSINEGVTITSINKINIHIYIVFIIGFIGICIGYQISRNNQNKNVYTRIGDAQIDL